MSTWISLHRKIQNNPLWTEEKFSKGQAWVDLLLLADYKTGSIPYGKLFLAKRWKWSRNKVTRYLSYLESEKMISLKRIPRWTRNDTQNDTQKRTHTITLITIEKWAFFQGRASAGDTHKRTQNDTPNETITIINNNIPPATKALEGNNEVYLDEYSSDEEYEEMIRKWRESNGKT